MADSPSKGPEKSVFDTLSDIFEQAINSLSDASKARKAVSAGPAASLVEASDVNESVNLAFEAKHDSSKYRLPETAKKVVVEAAKHYLLVGRVDQEAFSKAAKREGIVIDKETGADGKERSVNWYEDMSRTAKSFLKLKNSIDIKFPDLKDAAKKGRVMGVVETMSGMTNFTDAGWEKMIKDQGYTDSEVFGSQGAYQLLLSFQRSMQGINLDTDLPLFESKEKDKAPIVYKIRLEIASKAGKSDNDRLTRVLSTKLKAKKAAEPPKKEEPKKEPPKAEPPKKEEPKKEPPKAEPPKKEDPKKEPPKAEPPKKEEPKESPEALQLKDMLGKLRAAGFEIVIAPSKFGQEGYAKYDQAGKLPKRISFSCSQVGAYSYKMVTLPDGREDLAGKDVGVAKIKEDLDGMQFGDKVKVLKEDLLHVPGHPLALSPLKGKSPEGIEYDVGTYKAVVKGVRYQNKAGAISPPFDAEFEVVLNTTTGYSAMTKKGTPIPSSKDAQIIVKRAIEATYLEGLSK